VDITYEMEYDTKNGIHMRCYMGSVGFDIDNKFDKEEINQKIFNEGINFIGYSGYGVNKNKRTFTFDVDAHKTSDDTLTIDVTIIPKE
jgi:hypothetical protein